MWLVHLADLGPTAFSSEKYEAEGPSCSELKKEAQKKTRRKAVLLKTSVWTLP